MLKYKVKQSERRKQSVSGARIDGVSISSNGNAIDDDIAVHCLRIEQALFPHIRDVNDALHVVTHAKRIADDDMAGRLSAGTNVDMMAGSEGELGAVRGAQQDETRADVGGAVCKHEDGGG